MYNIALFIYSCEIQWFLIDFADYFYWFMWFSRSSSLFELFSNSSINSSRVTHSFSLSLELSLSLGVLLIPVLFLSHLKYHPHRHFISPSICTIFSKNQFHSKFTVKFIIIIISKVSLLQPIVPMLHHRLIMNNWFEIRMRKKIIIRLVFVH